MKLLNLIAALVIVGFSGGHAFAGQIVNIAGTNSIGTTVNLGAGTYNVTFIGTANGGAYNGVSINTGPTYTEEFSISLGATTNFNTSATYNYVVGGVQQGYSTALAALSAYQGALAAGTLGYSSSYTTQNYATTVNTISFTLATAGPVTFTVPDGGYSDNTGGVSLLVSAPEPASLLLLGSGLFGLELFRRRKLFGQRKPVGTLA